MTFAGTPSATDPNPYDLGATQVLNNKVGLLFYGYDQAANPFQGGTKCVAPPTRRTPVQDSGGNPPPDDCSGVYSYDFNARIQSGVDPNLTVGADVFAQYWSRDPLAPWTTGLTVVLATSGVSYALAVWRLAPLLDLAEGSRRLASGEASVRVKETDAVGEVRALARGIHAPSPTSLTNTSRSNWNRWIGFTSMFTNQSCKRPRRRTGSCASSTARVPSRLER